MLKSLFQREIPIPRFPVCRLVLLLFMLLLGTDGFARTAQQEAVDLGTGKSGKSFFSLGVSMNEFRSVALYLDTNVGFDNDGDYLGSTQDRRFPLTGQTWGYLLSYGTYINDYFRAELRGGKGFKKDTFDQALDVNLKYWFGGYLGFQHPITDYLSGHFLYGLTHFEADTTRRQITITVTDNQGFDSVVVVEPSLDRMEDGLFGTRFSTSWLLGMEFSLWQDTFLVFEYGRLLKDTASNIKVRQAGMHLKFEF